MEYLLKCTAVLSLFYGFYFFFLRKDTFFQSIRIYFLIGILSAITLPLLLIPKYVEITNMNWDNTTNTLANTTSNPIVNTISFTDVLLVVYFIGIAFFMGKIIWQISSLIWFLKSNKKEKIGKYNIIKTDKEIAPYSFFNYIVYNEKMFSIEELSQIVIHEKTHVNQLHSLDILFSHCNTIINWFNPLAWLYHKEVQKNLEFIADNITTQTTQTKKQYQYLLLKTSSPNQHLAFTSNFYNSLIKTRIDMLQKSRSQKGMQLKFALIIPVLIAFVFTFNTKIIAQPKEDKHIVVKKTDVAIEIITKNHQKIDLEALKARFLKQGIAFKYSGLKYNASNEITAIHISVKNNQGTQTKLSRSGKEAIQPIKIKIDTENNTIAMGDVSSSSVGDIVFYSDKGKNKKIIEERIEGGNTIFIDKDGKKTMHKIGGDNMVFVTKDDHGNIEEKVFAIKNNGDKNTNVWVTKNGDSTKVEKIKVMTWSSDDDVDINATEDIIIDLDKDNKVERKVIRVNSSSNNKPLIIVDGKEQENKYLEDIDPENIESVNVLKGDTATKKYGKKAKDGVVEITTKK